jgi:predicted ATP-grasp superfamily ATP-dependent carboligase
MVEFARSREDGQAYFLELNTRTSWTNQLYADAGIDLSQIAYRDLVNKTSVETQQYSVQIDDVTWLDFRRDWSSMRIKRKAGQITTLEWLGSLFKARSFAHWDWRDPIPFMAACIWRFRKAAAKPIQVDTG